MVWDWNICCCCMLICLVWTFFSKKLLTFFILCSLFTYSPRLRDRERERKKTESKIFPLKHNTKGPILIPKRKKKTTTLKSFEQKIKRNGTNGMLSIVVYLSWILLVLCGFIPKKNVEKKRRRRKKLKFFSIHANRNLGDKRVQMELCHFKIS